MELADFNLSHEDAMADDRTALMEALQKADDGNFLRSLAETVLQILMEAHGEGVTGAGRYERSGDRSIWRNSLSRGLTQGLPRPRARHAAGPVEPAHPEAADGQLWIGAQ